LKTVVHAFIAQNEQQNSRMLSTFSEEKNL